MENKRSFILFLYNSMSLSIQWRFCDPQEGIQEKSRSQM